MFTAIHVSLDSRVSHEPTSATRKVHRCIDLGVSHWIRHGRQEGTAYALNNFNYNNYYTRCFLVLIKSVITLLHNRNKIVLLKPT